ncbi:MAG: SDR family NAD(P)-dependent oxidoreductase [Burkholderiaceae bacterium]|nr:SDR family NAD(P)-dependent oxidoreductase [Burkholderiaceae bacterium]
MNEGNPGPLAWITGGGSGIGLAAARALGSAGFTLALSGRRAATLEAAVAGLQAEGIAAEAHVLDVSDADAVQRCANALTEAHGTIATLVCSAGTNVPNRFWNRLAPADFARVNAINLNGVAFCVSAVLPGMRSAGQGTIVVVSSWAGWRFVPFTGAAYGATKTGLAPLVESINDQEGRHGIRATLVCPGEVATEILRTRPSPPPDADIARMLQPEDLGAAVAYVVNAPPHVCVNELVISPTWNRIYIGADDLTRR